jgi:predicted AAA+ superfamily ATPase
VRLLDDAATLRAAQDDPAGFVEHNGLMAIDEIQLAPELLRAIKVLVDPVPEGGSLLDNAESAVANSLRIVSHHLPRRSVTP